MTVDKLQFPAKQNAVQQKINEIIDNLGGSNYVTTDTAQNITGVKTFVGQKMIAFKQSASGNKLGFTLYNNSGTEKGYLEYNPSNTVDSVPLMTLGNYASAAAGLTHVGFRKYSSVSGASGAYNLLAPLISDAKTPFNLTTTYTNFYLPLGFTNGNTTVLTAKTGLVDISSLLPSLSGYATETWVGQQGYITSSALSGYATETWVGNQGYAVTSSLATVATSGSYADLSNKPTIPTDTADLINGAGFLTSSDLTDGSLDAAFYESLSIGGVSSFYDSEEDILSISGSPIKIGEAVTISTETDPETGDNILYITDNITSDAVTFSSQGGISVDTSTSGGEFTYNGSEVATLSDIPSIPTVNNATLTIQKNGTTVNTFTANASTDVTANITVPTDLGDLTNNAGYTKNVGTVTSVNNVSPVNGNVTLSIPSEGANKDLSNLTATGEAHFQEPLVSGTNIKTINNTSVLGGGNIDTNEIFVAEYNVTSYADVQTAYNAGKTIFCQYTVSNALIFIPLKSKNLIVSSGDVEYSFVSSLNANGDYYCLYLNSSGWFPSASYEVVKTTSAQVGSSRFDGQWVISQSILVDTDIDLAVNTGRTFDLSSYLPSDNYNYEVLVAAVAQSTSTSGGTVNVSVYSDLITNTDDIKLCVGRTRASNTIICGGNAIIPIGTGRTIGLHQANISGTASAHKATITNFRAIAYRRIGTNS